MRPRQQVIEVHPGGHRQGPRASLPSRGSAGSVSTAGWCGSAPKPAPTALFDRTGNSLSSRLPDVTAGLLPYTCVGLKYYSELAALTSN